MNRSVFCFLVFVVLLPFPLLTIANGFLYLGAELSQIQKTNSELIDSRLDNEWKPAFQVGGRFSSHYSVQVQLGRGSEKVDSGLMVTETIIQGRKHWPNFRFAAIEPYLGIGLSQTEFDPNDSPGSVEQASLLLGDVGIQHLLGEHLQFDGGIRFMQDVDDQHAHQELYLALNYRLPLPKKKPMKEAEPAVTISHVVLSVSDSDGDGVTDNRDRCPNTPKGARVTAEGCAAILTETINLTLAMEFEFNSAVVSRSNDADLEQLAHVMIEYPGSQLALEGHTDSIGGAEFNQRLSQRRAVAVKKILVNHYQINSERITAIGKGESEPVASNVTEQGRAENRRVEATIAASREMPNPLE